MKRNVIRIALVVILVILGFSLYVLGKEHRVFVDNKDIVIDGVEYKAENTINVIVDDVDLEDVKKGKRKVANTPGPWHKIKATEVLPDGTTREIERKFTLSPNDTAIINLVALFEVEEGWLAIEKGQ
ncbi:MAG: hypothetical protein JW701_01085 [Kosmotogaceae bacterium]|nr:hypothetical protein [Kosmotogaceae bacterium]